MSGADLGPSSVGFIGELGAAGSAEDVYRITARWLVTSLGVGAAMIGIREGDNSLIMRAVGGGLSPFPDGSRVTLDSYAGRKLIGGDSMTIPDTAVDDGRAVLTSRLNGLGIRSALSVPMFEGDEVYGAILLGSAEPHFFEERHERLSRDVAGLIGVFLRAHERAVTDSLTGCISRWAVLEHLDELWAAGEERRPSLLYLDVDDFKRTNDMYGHAVGDAILSEIGARLRLHAPPPALVGRLGGDEFLIVVPDDRAGTAGREIAEALAASSGKQCLVGGDTHQPRLSIGVAASTEHTASAAELLQDADQAMYVAKRRKATVGIADADLRAQVRRSAVVDQGLRDAFRGFDRAYHYQPVCDLATGETIGTEALLRWSHPKLGPIPPNVILERIEQSGQIAAFTRWSLQQCLDDLADIRAQLPERARHKVGVNMQPSQLRLPGYADMHLGLLAAYGVEPKDIVVEVVESSEIVSGGPAARTLRTLGEAGVSISLDDFGTGHNAFWYLTEFPIDSIKFDRSLVGIVNTRDEARAILAALVNMCDDLDIVSLAEGIETEADQVACRELGVALGQGWHLGYPLPLDETIELLRAT